ncbi:hypothetical protein [Synechococcus sp. W4D4]|uniref:hypothetical protein n=1 Tax=Synechococcus sp. W4D4 TaxID=3392294 RepID=UPI0039EB3C47
MNRSLLAATALSLCSLSAPVEAFPLFNLLKSAASGAVKTYVPLPVPADIAVDAAIGSLEMPKRKAGWDKPPLQENVSSTDEEPTYVMARYGCGAGCLVRNLQLSEPEVIKDDWLRVEVLSQVWVNEYDSESDSWAWKQGGARVGPPESKSWWFAQCKEGLFTTNSEAELVEVSAESVFIEDGELKGQAKTQSVYGAIHSRWTKLCRFTETAQEDDY